MIPKTIIHLMSGGLDSTTLLYDLVGEGHKVHCMLFDYKQRHVQELTFAKLHCRRLNVLFTTEDLPQLRGSELTDGSGGVVVDARNAIFISHAAHLASRAKADTITIGCNASDEAVFPDCRMAFFQSINLMLMNIELKVQVWAPYIDKTSNL